MNKKTTAPRNKVTFQAPTGIGRIDKAISDHMEISRNQLQQMTPRFYINDRNVKPSATVQEGDTLTCTYHDLPEQEIVPGYIPLDIIYEDANTLVLNKEQGVVVHPAPGHYQETLIQGVLYYCKEMVSTFGDEVMRPGIVHRLDKDTSGVIIVGKNPESRDFLAAQFKDRLTEKSYLALVHGTPQKKRGTIETLHKRNRWDRQRFTVAKDGKEAITSYRVIESYGRYSLVEFRPKTGRTHQIRVHAKHMGHPIVGDPLYGARGEKGSMTLMLHAKELTITLLGESEPRTFSAEQPERFDIYIKEIQAIQQG